MTRTLKWLGAATLAMGLMTATTNAEAKGKGNPTGGEFAKEHPRRNEVNKRIDNQRARINEGVKDGKLDHQQAAQLRENDRAIKQQEHAEVKANGGHLTGAEQKQLNREENANSALIHDEKHPK